MTSLIGIAQWETTRLRGAVGTLDGVAGRLGAWRVRAEDLHGALGAAAFWTGASARSAAASVGELAAVAAQVAAAFAESLSAFHQLLAAADAAQTHAAEALATAAAVGVTLDDGSGVPLTHPPAPTATMAPDQAAVVGADATAAARASALAAEALAAARTAEAAAKAADAALGPVGVVDAFAPATFRDLEVALVGRYLPAPAPAPDPRRVARWWASLPAAEQDAAILAHPELVGALDGLPVRARDRANRLLLAGALAEPGTVESANAGTVADALARAESGGQEVQLWSLDLGQGLAAVALGDLDTADEIGVLVPGVATNLGSLGAQLGDARDVADATRQSAATGSTVATVAWLGYVAPRNLVAGADRAFAAAGGARLDAALDGLAASRRAGPSPQPRTTVLAHSYGTEVVEEAAGEDGELAADAVVLLGSPGMTGSAGDLEAPEVFQALAPWDPVRALGPLAWLDRPLAPLTGPLGQLTDAEGYGAVPLPTDGEQGHSDYYEPGHPTLAAIGGVVAGTSWR